MNTSFERNEKPNDEWLTPPEIIRALGTFDLDPAAPVERFYDMAKDHFTILNNGLNKEWFGRVWCNPPYGKNTVEWLKRCAEHKNCTALIYARTDTKMFFDYVWSKAHALLFLKGRISFYTYNGIKGNAAGAPSVLVAYNELNGEMLEQSGISGYYLQLNNTENLC